MDVLLFLPSLPKLSRNCCHSDLLCYYIDYLPLVRVINGRQAVHQNPKEQMLLKHREKKILPINS